MPDTEAKLDAVLAKYKVPQAQEIMMDEDMMGTMIVYDLNPYSPAKYPVPCKKRKKSCQNKGHRKLR